MRQLVELQINYKELLKHDAEIVAVFREEKLGVDGLRRVKEATAADFPLVLDYEGNNTSGYSQGSFDTYVIDKEGTICEILVGSKLKRPGGDAIRAALQKAAGS